MTLWVMEVKMNGFSREGNKMKTLKHFLAIMCAALTLAACNDLYSDGSVVPTQLEFAITVNQDVPTKAVKTEFVSGDVIYAFFNNVEVASTPKYAKLEYDGSKWNGSVQGGLAISELAATGSTMSAVYFPFGEVTISNRGSSYVFKGADGQPIYTYYMCATADYELQTAGEIATLTATLNMAIPENYVQFFVDKSGSDYATDGKYRLAVKDIRPAACGSYTTSGGFAIKALDYSQPMWGYVYDNQGLLFSGQIDATAWSSASERRFIFFETGAPAKSATISKTLASHAAVKLTNVAAWPAAVSVPTTADMGIYKNNDPTTGKTLLWATSNLGATEEYTGSWSSPFTESAQCGFLFAWGEIVPFYEVTSWQMKPEMNQAKYYWYDAATSSYSKYSLADDVLDPQDDAATAYLGSEWRLPTKAELGALLAYASEDGDSGFKMNNNGATIYFPFSGKRAGTGSPGRGKQGFTNYWSSTSRNGLEAWYNFKYGLEDENGQYYNGMAVRPVKEVQAISGLVHYWPFNGNLNDAVPSGAINGTFLYNSENGETHDATLTEDRHGNANSAYSFDGYNIISIGHAGDFGTSSFTANMWICTTATTYENTLIRTEGSSGGNGWFIRFKDSDIEIWASGNQYVSNTKINDGIWHMITFVHDTNNKVGQLYVDGVYKGGYTMSSVPNVSSDVLYTHVLGSGTHYRHCVYYGKMDEVRLYNKALTAEEVAALYQY